MAGPPLGGAVDVVDVVDVNVVDVVSVDAVVSGRLGLDRAIAALMARPLRAEG